MVLALAKIPNFVNFPLRGLYGRPRPSDSLVNVVGAPEGQSFPSGHAVLSVLLFGFLVFMLMQYTRSRRVLYGALAFLVFYIPFTGWYSIHYGRHWASDIVGGYLYGLLYLILAIMLFYLGRAWESRHPDALTQATARRLASRLGLFGART